MDASDAAPSEPADPFGYFHARGVTREALQGFFTRSLDPQAETDEDTGLPPIIAELHRVLGFDGMLAVIAQLGGTEVYVPAAEDAAARRWPGLPAEVRRAFVAHFGSSAVTVPMLRHVFSACRRDAIMQLKASGLAVNAIARKFGVSARAVRHIVRKAAGQAKADAPC